MINVMKKVSVIGTAAAYYLYSAASAFAATTPTEGPTRPAGANKVFIQPPGGAVKSTAVTIDKVIAFVINLLFVVGLIAAVAFLIYGGIKWILSGGDKAKVEAARNHIVAAIVGLIVIAAAFVIISLVFSILGVGNPLGGELCIPTLVEDCKGAN